MAPDKVTHLIYTKKKFACTCMSCPFLFFLRCTSSEKDISDGRTSLLLLTFHKKWPPTNPNLFFNRTTSGKDISNGRTCLLLLIFHKKSPQTNPNPNPKHLA